MVFSGKGFLLKLSLVQVACSMYVERLLILYSRSGNKLLCVLLSLQTHYDITGIRSSSFFNSDSNDIKSCRKLVSIRFNLFNSVAATATYSLHFLLY